MKEVTTSSFRETWAMRAWKAEIGFDGNLNGGIGPVKQLHKCIADGDTVMIQYRYPVTCGLSDVRYHVTDPYRIRTDIFHFTKTGRILMNGKPFLDAFVASDPWNEKKAREFAKEYAAELMNLRKGEDQ